MKFRRAIVAIVSVCVLGGGAAIVAAAPEAGATVYIYGNANYGPVQGSFSGTNGYWGNFGGGGSTNCPSIHPVVGWNDCVSSIINYNANSVVLYENANYGGGYFTLASGHYSANLTGYNYSNGHNLNDSISSDIAY